MYFYSVGVCVFINFAFTDPRLQQRNWSQQIWSERKWDAPFAKIWARLPSDSRYESKSGFWEINSRNTHNGFLIRLICHEEIFLAKAMVCTFLGNQHTNNSLGKRVRRYKEIYWNNFTVPRPKHPRRTFIPRSVTRQTSSRNWYDFLYAFIIYQLLLQCINYCSSIYSIQYTLFIYVQ